MVIGTNNKVYICNDTAVRESGGKVWLQQNLGSTQIAFKYKIGFNSLKNI
ncbi:hypothetical protein [Chryseobacterium limigenitum]|nr:hypothetical protein [Chryseobacterium limigenitum]